MISAAALAFLLAGQPAVLPIAERPRVIYRIKKRKPRPAAPPDSSRADMPIAPTAEPRRVRTIPIIDFGEFYRRVGL